MRLICLLLVSILPLASSAFGQTKPESRATKFVVEAQEKVVPYGKPVEVKIKLTDAENHERPAKTDIPAEVTIKTAEGRTQRVPVTFKPGESIKQVPLTIDSPGIADIKVTHPEFLDGGTAVKVKAAKPGGLLWPPTSAPSRMFTNAAFGAWSRGQPLVLPVTHRRTGQYSIELKKSPDREMLSNGKDPVEISAFVVDEEDTQEDEIRIWAHHSGGSLDSNPILIPREAEVGTAHLVSVDSGMVTFTIMSTHPAAVIKGSSSLSMTFVPAVSRIDVAVTPATVTLFDDATVDITLEDASGNTIATHRDRSMSLSLKEGRGELEPRDVTIKAQGFNERARVQPTSPGRLMVAVRSPNLRIAESNLVRVAFPVLAVLSALVGGGIGGLLSCLNEKLGKLVRKRSGQLISVAVRVVIGAVAGLILYYLALQGAAPKLSSRYLATSIGQFVVGFVGGWTGPSVFDGARALFGVFQRSG